MCTVYVVYCNHDNLYAFRSQCYYLGVVHTYAVDVACLAVMALLDKVSVLGDKLSEALYSDSEPLSL